MLVRRVTYFSMFYEKLEKLFAKETSAVVGDEMWLSSEEIPLKWLALICVCSDAVT